MTQIVKLVRGQTVELRKDTRTLVIKTVRTTVAGGGSDTASALATTGAAVNVGASDPPTAGQILIATSPILATWQDAPGGGGGGSLDDAYNLGSAITVDSGPITLTADAIAQAETSAFELINTTDAADNVQQFSPMAVFEGQGFGSGGGSQQCLFAVQLEPIQALGNPTARLRFRSNINGAGFVDGPTIDSDGGFVAEAGADLTGPGFFRQGRRSGFAFNIQNRIFAFANQVNLWIGFPNQFRVVPVGTAATPSIALGTGSKGQFSPGVDMLAISTDNLEAVRWDASQNQINAAGVALASGQLLRLDGSTGGDYLQSPTTNALGLFANAAEAARVDNNATAAETRFMLYDVDNDQLERVSVGAADSGGAGFKLLRIPN